MDRDTLLRRFEAEYLELNSITPKRRDEQLKLLVRLDGSLGDRTLDQLTAADVRAFVGADLGRGLHPNTARKYMGMIRSFVGWAGEAHVLTQEVTSEIRSLGNPRGSSSKTRPNPYKPEEVRELRRIIAARYPPVGEFGHGSRMLTRLLAGKTDRMHGPLLRHAKRLQFEAQVSLALECGLRRIEIVRLTVPAMHYDNDQVVVLTAKQGPGAQVHRTVPYTAHARACVQEWLDFRLLLGPRHESPWLMLDYVGNLAAQIRPQTYRAMSRSLERFGPKWRWHRLRHTAATEWLRSGVPLEKVRVFLGHATLEQTSAYTQILDRDVERAFSLAEADFARRLGLVA